MSLFLDKTDMNFLLLYEDKQKYASFFKLFAKCDLCKAPYKKFLFEFDPNFSSSKKLHLFQEIFTPVQEAFLFVVLENNYHRWRTKNG